MNGVPDDRRTSMPMTNRSFAGASAPTHLARRAWLQNAWRVAGCLALSPLALAACAGRMPPAPDRIVQVASGRLLRPEDVLAQARRADFVLLGELHDNPEHHRRRAEVLTGLGKNAAVVAEHLPRGPLLRLPPPDGDALRKALEAGGFEARAWNWPLHEPLFAAVARAQGSVRGGNLDRAAVRKLAIDGEVALPADLAAWTDAAPMSQSALAELEDDLQRGHCGRMPAARMPGMVAAQRGRDASMAQTLADERERLRKAGVTGPVVLLAGNGHVRRDYGVAQLLAARWPKARILSVESTEHGAGDPGAEAPFDVVWFTPPAEREDPCKNMPDLRLGAR